MEAIQEGRMSSGRRTARPARVQSITEVSTAHPEAGHCMVLACETLAASLQWWKQANSWLGVRLRTWKSFGAMARLVVTYIICLSKLTDATLKMGTFYIQIIPQCWLKTKWKKNQRWPDIRKARNMKEKIELGRTENLQKVEDKVKESTCQRNDMLHRVCFCFLLSLMFGVT